MRSAVFVASRSVAQFFGACRPGVFVSWRLGQAEIGYGSVRDVFERSVVIVFGAYGLVLGRRGGPVEETQDADVLRLLRIASFLKTG